jgi:hypothetical protein
VPKTGKFPEHLFVTWYNDSDGALELQASETESACLDSVSQEVATYKLVKVRRGRLVPHFDE